MRKNLRLLPVRQLRLLTCAWARWLVTAIPDIAGSDYRFRALRDCESWAFEPTFENKNKVVDHAYRLNTEQALAVYRSSLNYLGGRLRDSDVTDLDAASAVSAAAKANYGTTVTNAVSVYNTLRSRFGQVLLVRSFDRALGPPGGFDPSWRTETAAALARGIVADRAFDRLPILADALEEAGMDYAPVLSHFRQGVHQAELSDWPLWHLTLTAAFPERV